MEETTLIPDAVEPVLGWRSFKLVNGYLISPQQNVVWKPKIALIAECGTRRHMRTTLEWIARMGPATPDEDLVEAFSTDEMLKHKPTIELPSELSWDLVRVEKSEQVPYESCNCGIHLAKELVYAITYGEGSVMIVGKVAGWGKVIEGTKGYRAQYAYPQELYVGNKYPDMNPEAGEKTIAWLQAYGVPVYVIEALIEAESEEARKAIQARLQ